MATQSTMLTITCAQCGETAERAYRGTGVKPTLCGNACKVRACRRRHPDRVKQGRDRETIKRLALQASQYHQDCLMYRRWARQARPAPVPEHKPKRCRDCGQDVAKGAQRCAPCRSSARQALKQTEWYRAAARATKARRRAVERGIDAERFDPFEILERDGWRCHMCGCETPKALRGTFEPNAPELDHIMPLAAGGKHTRLNTACSCRACNARKGSTVQQDRRQAA